MANHSFRLYFRVIFSFVSTRNNHDLGNNGSVMLKMVLDRAQN